MTNISFIDQDVVRSKDHQLCECELRQANFNTKLIRNKVTKLIIIINTK